MVRETLLSVQGLSTWFELRRWGFGRAGYIRAVDGLDFELFGVKLLLSSERVVVVNLPW